MIGIILSAIAVFLGIVTKLPQGGGGLANNLMAMGLFLSAPPLLPPPPPRAIFFDLDTAIFENQHFYMHDPVVSGNITQGPLPRPSGLPRSDAGSSSAPAQNGTFTFAAFSFPVFPPPLHFFQLCDTMGEIIGTVAMVLIMLCLPWLVIKHMHLLGKTGPALKAASEPIATVFGERVAQIEQHNRLFGDLQLILSERDQARVELTRATEKAKSEGEKALERACERERNLEWLQKERDVALAELAKGKENLKRLEREKKEEVDGLKEETKQKQQAWEAEKRKSEEEKEKEEKKNQEEIDGLKMGRERESESWRKEVEKLETEKKGEKEAMGAKMMKIHEGIREEREVWEKEKGELRQEKEEEKREREEIEAEKKDLEGQRAEEKKLCEEASERAQERIAELEEENRHLKADAAEKKKLLEEQEAASKTAEEKKAQEQKDCEEEREAEAKKVISKLEEEVLNGRKLIGDLQSDKRRDRQLLLELRAQLVRPTYAAPPSHMNPLRFGGRAPQAAYGAPVIPTPSTSSTSTSPPARPKVNLPPTLPFNSPQATDRSQPISFGAAVNQDVGLPVASLPPRPIVRLPSRAPPRSSIIHAGSPPPIAPKGPKGW